MVHGVTEHSKPGEANVLKDFPGGFSKASNDTEHHVERLVVAKSTREYFVTDDGLGSVLTVKIADI